LVVDTVVIDSFVSDSFVIDSLVAAMAVAATAVAATAVVAVAFFFIFPSTSSPPAFLLSNRAGEGDSLMGSYYYY
jgi:hypothetical protein